MDYVISGGNSLKGELQVYGAKNCALALLGATVLTDDVVVLNNCPLIVDVENMLLLLSSLGKKIQRQGTTVVVQGELNSTVAPFEVATLLRGSALILGSTLAKYGRVQLPLPGGCAIGARPMDVHIDGLSQLGCDVRCVDGCLLCSGRLVGKTVTMRTVSVGATENLVCAATLAQGQTVLHNCATEPEVVALQNMLCLMGAKISGVGTKTVAIEGVDKLHGVTFDIIPDRVVAATYLAAAIAAGGSLTITKCNPTHLQAFLNVVGKGDCLDIYDDAVTIAVHKRPHGFGIVKTAPYPLFPTDMQSLLLSLSCFANGNTVICETLFESRLQHNAQQLQKMGANVTVEGNVATIVGGNLHGANIRAYDLRGGAGLVVAALNAKGTSVLCGVEHINRGYYQLAQSLNSVGANISLI